MNYWLISDTHFNHQQIEQWGGRSGDWQEKIWKGLRLLTPTDVLIHLGDICIGDDEKIHRGLNNLHCKKILVRGNHDKKSHNWYLEHGWGFVCDAFELIYQGYYIHLTHRPARPFGNQMMNIHGHTHGNMHRSEEHNEFYDPKYHIDISPELVGYAPHHIDSIITMYKKRQ